MHFGTKAEQMEFGDVEMEKLNERMAKIEEKRNQNGKK